MELYKWQTEALASLKANSYKGIVECATGSGKTIFGMEAMKALRVTTLIVVPTEHLMLQWKKDIMDYLAVDESKIGLLGAGSKDINKPIVIAIINSVRELKVQKKLAIFDECLSKNSRILLPDFITEKIKDIVDKKSIKKVLSYNEEKNIFEPKKIAKYIKTPFAEQWVNIKIKSSSGKIFSLFLTENHKIWTNNGYKQVKELNANDILKVNEFEEKVRCNICNKLVIKGAGLGGHISSHNKIKKEYTCPICNRTFMFVNSGFLKGHIKLHDEMFKKEKYRKSSKTLKRSEKHRQASLKLKERTGIKNPMHHSKHSEEFWKEFGNNKRKWFNSLTKERQDRQIKIFNTAPRFRYNKKATNLERAIIDMHIPNLIYSSKGCNCTILQLKNRRKIPDFIVKGQNKVVEVGDTIYWHTQEEIEKTKQEYEECGYRCLYLTDKDLKSPEEVKKIILNFMNNHEAKILSITHQTNSRHINRKKGTIVYKYNLEVEDNHNYIANNILVSNCHRYASDENLKVLLLNHFDYKVGLTATLDRADSKQKYLITHIGKVVYKLKQSEAIANKYLCEFEVINVGIPLTKEEQDEYSKVNEIINLLFKKFNYNFEQVKQALCFFDVDAQKVMKAIVERRMLLCNASSKIDAIIKLIKPEDKVIVFCEFIELAEALASKLTNYAIYHSKMKAKERRKMLEEYKNNKINILVCVKGLDEGMNIVDANIGIIAASSKVRRQTIQRLGRILRYKEGKTAKIYNLYCQGTKDYEWCRKRNEYFIGNAIDITWKSINEI